MEAGTGEKLTPMRELRDYLRAQGLIPEGSDERKWMADQLKVTRQYYRKIDAGNEDVSKGVALRTVELWRDHLKDLDLDLEDLLRGHRKVEAA